MAIMIKKMESTNISDQLFQLSVANQLYKLIKT